MAVETPRKSVFVTGCSSGIGHALAIEFHSKGFFVIATARRKESIADLEALGISTISLEVKQPESIAQAKKDVEALTGGKLDILVNNAGRNYTIPALDVELDEARDVFETNVIAVIAITQAFAPLLIKSKGLILNIGSVAAIVPYVFGSVYNASKAALHAFSQTLRLELEPYDVRVLVVITGGVKSEIARTTRALPKDSLYLDINEHYMRRQTHSQAGAMTAEDYAKEVVREALKAPARQRKWLWEGNMAYYVWFLQAWVGKWTFDYAMPRMFGLIELRGKVLGKAGAKQHAE